MPAAEVAEVAEAPEAEPVEAAAVAAAEPVEAAEAVAAAPQAAAEPDTYWPGPARLQPRLAGCCRSCQPAARSYNGSRPR